MSIGSYLVPIIIISLLIFSRYKKIDTYSTFVKGAKGAFNLVLDIFPYVATIMIMVALMRVSGLMDILISLVSPIFMLLGVPEEVLELVLLRPFTGGGSYSVLKDIYLTYGPDTYISRCASVIMGTSETIFYVTAVYFSQTSVKKLSYAIPLAICFSIFGTIVACLVCKIL